jgi:ATP-dependent DNA helicase DinG
MPELAAILGADGPLARALPGYRARPAQVQMAVRIQAALELREVLLVEAGTGTGKTFAYLVPVLRSGRRVLISTGTRTLQDQLFHRDLPLLAGALGRPARVTLLKGRSNYLCLERLGAAGMQPALFDTPADGLYARILEWARVTRSGDLAELPALSDSHPLRSQVTSTRENCFGARCPQFAACHVFQARRAAMESDIVVVNHHLLLADMALKEDGFGDLLPSVDAVILDEAHQLPDLASEFFGQVVSSRQFDLLLTDLRAQFPGAQLPGAQSRLELEQAVAAVLRALKGPERNLAWRELDGAVHDALAALAVALAACEAALRAADPSPALEVCAQRASGLREALALIEAPEEDAPAGARTASTSGRGFVLRFLPYDIATRFCSLLKAGQSAWIFTSATLAVGDDFSHFASRLGLEGAATVRFESPFDYARQALLYLPQGLPAPGDARYGEAVLECARPLLEASGGGAFLLFTSHRALRAAAQSLERTPPANGPLLIQGSAPREQLLRRFRASGSAVLLGTASFWEGVDVQGSALRLVIIDRLPFASPEDPVVRSRIEYLQAQGGNPFMDYQLPEAVLTLKQGVGRLIRSEVDEGVVVICDPRLSERGYGRVFRASLPPMAFTHGLPTALERLRALRGAQETGGHDTAALETGGQSQCG